MSFLFKAFLFIFAAFFIFAFATRRYRNHYKLYMVFGKKGSGKSTFLISQAVKYIEKGWIVYTNMLDCAVPGVRLISVQKLGQFVPEENSLLLLDEVGMVWDARDFKNFRPSVRDFFKLQRHYRVICILASQTWDIDKKLRDLTDGLYLFQNFLNVFSVGKRIVRKIVLTEATSEAESRISENLKFAPFWNWKYLYIPKWAPYYDSFDVPKMPKLPYRVIKGDPDRIEQSKLKYKVKHLPEYLRGRAGELREKVEARRKKKHEDSISPICIICKHDCKKSDILGTLECCDYERAVIEQNESERDFCSIHTTSAFKPQRGDYPHN